MGKLRIRGVILIFIAFLITLCLLGVLGIYILLNADMNYECYRDFVVGFIKRDNHFDGDLWFSAVATLIGAIISAAPGLICGIFALIQTNRLHKLESRYHRPMLELDMAELKFIRTKNREDVLEYASARLSERQNSGIREALQQKQKWYIDLQITFFLKNEITIKEIYVQRVIFILNDKEYEIQYSQKADELRKKRHETWDYERQIEEKRVTYLLSWNICSFKKFNNEAEFWERVIEFANYNEMRNPDYLYMTMRIYINIKYEYGGEQETVNLLKVDYNAMKADLDKFAVTNKSLNGYFTYEYKG